MTPSIIVHIGPPKTATTSLQIALEEISHPNFHYAGTLQPRARNADSLCQRLYHVCSGKSPHQDDIKNVRDELKSHLQEGKTIFLSEEMFLLEQDHASIQSKIKLLRNVLAGFDCKILISARPGKSALPSLYQEIFNSLPMPLQIDFSAFCRDKRSACYDYSDVCKMLEGTGFDDIIISEFDKLSSGSITLAMLTGCPEFKPNTLTLPKANGGRLGVGESGRRLPRVSLKSFGRFSPIKLLIQKLRLRSLPGYGSLAGVLDRVTLIGAGERTLKVPDEVANRLDHSYRQAVDRYSVRLQNIEGRLK